MRFDVRSRGRRHWDVCSQLSFRSAFASAQSDLRSTLSVCFCTMGSHWQTSGQCSSQIRALLARRRCKPGFDSILLTKHRVTNVLISFIKHYIGTEVRCFFCVSTKIIHPRKLPLGNSSVLVELTDCVTFNRIMNTMCTIYDDIFVAGSVPVV